MENIKVVVKDLLFVSVDDVMVVDEDEDDIVVVVDVDEEWEDVEDDVKLLFVKFVFVVLLLLVCYDDDVMDLSEDVDDVDDELYGDGIVLKCKSVYFFSYGFFKGRSLGGWDVDEEEVVV